MPVNAQVGLWRYNSSDRTAEKTRSATPMGCPMRCLPFAVVLALSLFVAAPALPQTAQSGPPAPNPAWKVPEVIAFIGVKSGDKVADIIAGRLTGALAQAVGPTGKV